MKRRKESWREGGGLEEAVLLLQKLQPNGLDWRVGNWKAEHMQEKYCKFAVLFWIKKWGFEMAAWVASVWVAEK